MCSSRTQYQRMAAIAQSEYEADEVSPNEGKENYGSIKASQYDQIANQECCEWGTRHTFALLSFLGFANMYAMRVNLSVAIVAMVNAPEQSNNTNIGQECPMQNHTNAKLINVDGNFDWDNKEQGLILGAFYCGYIVTQIPAGFLAEKYGGKWFYGLGVLCTSVFTLLTPVAAEVGVVLLVLCKVLSGLGEGMTFPAMHAMVSRWAPLGERSKFVTFIASGAQFGTFVGLSISGVLAAHISWPSLFYFFGVLGCIWFVFWIFLVVNTPQEHPRISLRELDYIENHILQTTNESLPSPPIRYYLNANFVYCYIILLI